MLTIRPPRPLRCDAADRSSASQPRGRQTPRPRQTTRHLALEDPGSRCRVEGARGRRRCGCAGRDDWPGRVRQRPIPWRLAPSQLAPSQWAPSRLVQWQLVLFGGILCIRNRALGSEWEHRRGARWTLRTIDWTGLTRWMMAVAGDDRSVGRELWRPVAVLPGSVTPRSVTGRETPG